MSDGLEVPDHADGMGCFKGKNGNIILIRNHEIGHFKKIEKLLDKNPIYICFIYIREYFMYSEHSLDQVQVAFLRA